MNRQYFQLNNNYFTNNLTEPKYQSKKEEDNKYNENSFNIETKQYKRVYAIKRIIGRVSK